MYAVVDISAEDEEEDEEDEDDDCGNHHVGNTTDCDGEYDDELEVSFD